MPLERRTRATLRSAEFGFFGVSCTRGCTRRGAAGRPSAPASCPSRASTGGPCGPAAGWWAQRTFPRLLDGGRRRADASARQSRLAMLRGGRTRSGQTARSADARPRHVPGRSVPRRVRPSASPPSGRSMTSASGCSSPRLGQVAVAGTRSAIARPASRPGRLFVGRGVELHRLVVGGVGRRCPGRRPCRCRPGSACR